MPDVSDEELRKEIEKILKSADLSKVSSKKVIQQLEEKFDTEFKDRKAVGKMVMDYVNSMESEEEEEEDDKAEESASSPEPPKRAKRTKKARKDSSAESEEGDDSNDSDFEKKKPKKAPAKGKKAGGKGGGRGKGGGYTRAYKLSPALAELMGAEEMPRHEVVKRMWALIKERQLYDTNNKQFAICDEALHKVIGTKRFRIFGMMKYLKSHFLE